ncbi:MAG: hypothetical protein WA908_03480, partial [Pontixanthobacter sp.]
GETIGALLLLPGDAAALIGPAWTLAFEMYFYLCFGVAMIGGLDRGMLVLFGAFLALIAAGIAFPIANPVWALATNPLLLEFLAGTAIAWLCVKGFLPRRGGIALIVASCAIFAAGLAYGYDRLPTVVVWGVPSTLLVAGLVMAERTHGAHVIVRKLGHFGDSSYALYLIHIIIIAIALFLATRFAGSVAFEPSLIAIPIACIAIAAGEFLHHRIERPLLKYLNPKRPLVPVETRVS